ncbi:MAG: hypothetical protein LQ337_004263 [Flavoplaca oasis]|nr:MAG: hypothetical protein LQ337_004263 [Flavoplaca oasis]
MYSLLPLYSTLFLILYCLPIRAIDVILAQYASPAHDAGPTPTVIATALQVCRDLPPGRCCAARPLDDVGVVGGPNAGNLQPGHQPYNKAYISGLNALDIAALWRPIPANNINGCAGIPFATRPGPGSWQFPFWGTTGLGQVISGASYIRLPASIPKERAQAPMMAAQGILGLITGGGSWVAPTASKNTKDQMSSVQAILAGGRPWSRRVKRRVIVRGDKGWVFAQPPRGSVWPNLIMVNGTNFTVIGEGSKVYRSEAGRIMDFTGK